MRDLLDIAKEESIEKIAASRVMAMAQLRHNKPKKKKRGSRTTTKAVIVPKEPTESFWRTPAGQYTEGATLGAGTAAAGQYLATGSRYGKSTPFLKKPEDVVSKGLEKLKKIKIPQAIKALSKGDQSKWLRDVADMKRRKTSRAVALLGAGAGIGATAYMRHKAKKRKEELKNMPQQITVRLPGKLVKSAANLGVKQPALPKAPKSPVKAPPKAPGASQKEQSTKITMAPINKAASDRAHELLERLRS